MNYIFEFISCVILFISACIHNEMIVIKICGFYECTDYYKTEVQGFPNIDIDFDTEQSGRYNDENSLMDNSSINNFGD